MTPEQVQAATLRGLAWLGASTITELAAWPMLQHTQRRRVLAAVKALAAAGHVEPAGVGDRNARCYRLTDAGRARVQDRSLPL